MCASLSRRCPCHWPGCPAPVRPDIGAWTDRDVMHGASPGGPRHYDSAGGRARVMCGQSCARDQHHGFRVAGITRQPTSKTALVLMCHGRRRPAIHDFVVWHRGKTWGTEPSPVMTPWAVSPNLPADE